MLQRLRTARTASTAGSDGPHSHPSCRDFSTTIATGGVLRQLVCMVDGGCGAVDHAQHAKHDPAAAAFIEALAGEVVTLRLFIRMEFERLWARLLMVVGLGNAMEDRKCAWGGHCCVDE